MMTGVILIGRYDLEYDLSPSLYIAHTMAHFHCGGTIPYRRLLLNNQCRYMNKLSDA